MIIIITVIESIAVLFDIVLMFSHMCPPPLCLFFCPVQRIVCITHYIPR